MLVHFLHEGEEVVADGGYRDSSGIFTTPTGLNNEDQTMKQLARSRHEVVNRRIKQWGIVSTVYRHNPDTHGKVFIACTVITSLIMQLDQPIFHVEYDDNEFDDEYLNEWVG
jgi:hypothetical protein